MGKLLKSLLMEQVLNKKNHSVKIQIKTFQAGEKILTTGIVYPFFCMIDKGSVKVILTKGHVNNDEFIKPIITHLHKNEIFGEFGLFNDSPASADVFASTNVELIEINKKSFLNFMKTHPELGYDILVEMLETLFRRIDQLNKTSYHLFKNAIEFKSKK